jgi:hypothetical protein
MARAILKVQAAYGRLDDHFAHAAGIDVVHETTDAVPCGRNGWLRTLAWLRASHRRVRRTHRAGTAADGPKSRVVYRVQAALGVVHEHHFACAQKAL